MTELFTEHHLGLVRLALSLKYLGLTTTVPPSGDIEVVNLATGHIRTWTSRAEPGYWPGAPTWLPGGTTLTFAWCHTTSRATGAAVIAGTRQLHLSALDSNLAATPYDPFPVPVSGMQSALVTPDSRDIIASSCHAASGGPHHTATARILELPTSPGPRTRVLYTQTATFKNSADEQDALGETCALLSADPSGEHLLVQAFGFGRIDDGVFTALPGASPGVLSVAAGW